MGRRTSIPVKVRRPGENQTTTYRDRAQAGPPPASAHEVEKVQSVAVEPERQEQSPAPIEFTQSTDSTETQSSQDADEWRDRALRLQAEMDNFRRRQRRLAEERIETERKRLLGAFLGVSDNLERALATPDGDEAALRQGLQLTHRAGLHLMDREGAEQIEAENQAFDPTWHEAVATVGRNGTNVAPGTVVQVIERGYRLGGQLLRPAKVIVAI